MARLGRPSIGGCLRRVPHRPAPQPRPGLGPSGRAVELHTAGRTYDEIAELLGYKNRGAYRNIAIYLATRAQRAQVLFAAIWNAMIGSYPGAFSRGFSVSESGQRAVDALGRDAPQCFWCRLWCPR